MACVCLPRIPFVLVVRLSSCLSSSAFKLETEALGLGVHNSSVTSQEPRRLSDLVLKVVCVIFPSQYSSANGS